MDLLNGPSSISVETLLSPRKEKEAELFFAAQRSKLQPKGELREGKKWDHQATNLNSEEPNDFSTEKSKSRVSTAPKTRAKECDPQTEIQCPGATLLHMP